MGSSEISSTEIKTMIHILIITSTFLIMEPFTALSHRYIMHMFGWKWHKSHHDRIGQRFELNDLFPIVFSLLAIALFVIGMSHPIIRDIAIGITVYGAVYFVVHEIVIHSRFLKLKNDNLIYRYWRFSHNVHHQFQGAPYGFIFPITPKSLKQKAKDNYRDLINRYSSQKSDR